MLRVKNMYIKLLPLYVGLALLIASPTYLAHKRDSAVKVAAASAQAKLEATSQTEVSKNISGMPVRIIMPAQLIDLPVVKGYYLSDKKVWYVAPTSATYATNTEPLNNIGGMSLIYGHDYSYVF
ncbi:MAG TPA: hypothetical protein VFB03_03370, partial [Candidatus Saccharimonadales bacterium]|nr:hypothetical protein [Candidatus Saccharimonadales bacterium]